MAESSGWELPNFVNLTISKCDPAVKSDTVTGATKPAHLETGAQVHVPLFINEGDKVRVDTRSGEVYGTGEGVSHEDANTPSDPRTLRAQLGNGTGNRQCGDG